MLIASTLMAMITVGGLNSFSILYKELLDFYDTRAGDTAIISSLCIFLNFAIGPFANYASEIYSFRVVMFVGGFFGFLGLFLSAFVSRMELWILTYGVFSGIGFGLVYSPCFTVVNFYFKKRRALAISILLLGTGIGSVVFPFIYHSLIHCYGLQGAVLVISALSLNICVCAALIRQPQELQKGKIPLSKQTSTETNSYELENDIIKPRRSCCECSTRRPIREIFHFSLIRKPSFFIYALALMCSIYAYFSIFTMIPGHARVQGMSSARVAVLLSVNGGVMIFARPVVGLLADSKIIQKRNIIGTFLILGGVSSILLPWFTGYYPLLVYSITQGLFPGSFFMFIPLLLLEIVPLENLPQAQGLLNLCLSLPVGISQPLPGWIRDVTGDWTISFRVSGGVALLAGLLFFVEPAFRTKCKRKCNTSR